MTIRKKHKSNINSKGIWFLFDWYFSNIWVARGIAITGLINLGLVCFDYTYIPLRDFWLQGKTTILDFKIGPLEYQGITLKLLPPIVTETVPKYDVIKGIVPYRDTDEYLKLVHKFKEKQDNLDSPEVQNILAELRERSVEIIDTNPFQLANKTGTLEKIKNIMRDHVPNPQNSSKQAFLEFWSQQYLQGKTFQELQFFEQEIEPLIATNYYRPMGETGEFVDYFGLIDFPFFMTFLIDFLGRTLYISRRHTGVNWLDAMLWRWYDIFLLIPLWRWARIIPVTIRLNETKIINLRKIQKQASQGFVASIAEDLTEVVVLRIINQVQYSVSEGEISKLITQRKQQEYIDLNDINETVEIIKLMGDLVFNQVLPQLRNDIENILKYNLDKVINQLPAYQSLKKLPGIETIEEGITQQISRQIYQLFYESIKSLLEEDPIFNQLLEKLISNLTQTINSEIKAKQNIDKIEVLLTDLLEEIKINYVRRLSEEDIEEILDQTRALRQQ